MAVDVLKSEWAEKETASSSQLEPQEKPSYWRMQNKSSERGIKGNLMEDFVVIIVC